MSCHASAPWYLYDSMCRGVLPARSGHCAALDGRFMLMFGGSFSYESTHVSSFPSSTQGHLAPATKSLTNAVHQLDCTTLEWVERATRGVAPSARQHAASALYRQ